MSDVTQTECICTDLLNNHFSENLLVIHFNNFYNNLIVLLLSYFNIVLFKYLKVVQISIPVISLHTSHCALGRNVLEKVRSA